MRAQRPKINNKNDLFITKNYNIQLYPNCQNLPITFTPYFSHLNISIHSICHATYECPAMMGLDRNYHFNPPCDLT